MVRALILLLLVGGFVLLMAPFAISSLWIDQRGIEIPGRVFSKDERVVVRDSSWSRSAEVTVEYDPPHESMVAFLTATVSPERFDELKKGELVKLRFLRREDLPQIPGAKLLRSMHALPTARLAEQRSWSALQLAYQARTTFLAEVVIAIAVLLLLWKLLHLPLLGWMAAASVFCGTAAVMLHSFPVPVPAPQMDIRRALGTVKSVELVEYLFGNDHESFEAKQPVQIVGVQFVPEGRAQAVLAVDLIDADSVRGLREHSAVAVEYERGAPRIAHILGASRSFVQTNLSGAAIEIVVALGVLAALLAGWLLINRGYRKTSPAAAP